MPHKLHGGILGSKESQVDLPPNSSVQSSSIPSKSSSANTNTNKIRADRDLSKHDTPRAFSRLFQPYRAPRASEDDGIRHAKRRKVATSSDVNNKAGLNTEKSGLQVTRNRESLRNDDRSTRNAAKGRHPRTSSKPELSLKDISKASKTKTEKKMQRMQQEWRREDERLKAKRQRVGEDLEGFVDEENVEEMGVDVPPEGSRSAKKRKKSKEANLWESIGTEERQGPPSGRKGLVGLHDVVQAPPRLKRPSIAHSSHPKAAAGGLKRQAELSEGRKQVIEGYRAMMKERRGDVGDL